MREYLEKDEAARTAASVAKWGYALSGALIALLGAREGNAYRCLMGLGSLLLIPALAAVYRSFGLLRGWQLEIWIYAFAYLSVTLGGGLDLYMIVRGYDKLMHMLSGTFTALAALALYLYLERRRPVREQSAATAALFVFFASMAVAALFEIGEFVLAPIVGRDLQRVAGTGVRDTITDMIVCLIGTLCALPWVVRFYRGERNLFAGAAASFLYKNPQPTPDDGGGLPLDPRRRF